MFKLKHINGFWKKGFTLVETIVVLAIIAILVALIVPSFISIKEKACKAVCNLNCQQLRRMYDAYLILENIDHTNNIFEIYLQEYGKKICPAQGDIIYRNGSVQCSVHSKAKNDENGGQGDEDVPFL